MGTGGSSPEVASRKGLARCRYVCGVSERFVGTAVADREPTRFSSILLVLACDSDLPNPLGLRRLQLLLLPPLLYPLRWSIFFRSLDTGDRSI